MSTACTATPASSSARLGVPIARRMAKSRWRSSAERNTTAPMITAVTSHSRARTRSTDDDRVLERTEGVGGDVVGRSHDRAVGAVGRQRSSSRNPDTTSPLLKYRSCAVGNSTNTSGRPASTVRACCQSDDLDRLRRRAAVRRRRRSPAVRSTSDLARAGDRRGRRRSRRRPSTWSSVRRSPPTTTTSSLAGSRHRVGDRAARDDHPTRGFAERADAPSGQRPARRERTARAGRQHPVRPRRSRASRRRARG